MNKGDQITILTDLVNGVVVQMTSAIAAGKVPEQWDGIELRQWLADSFAAEATPMSPARLRKYHNTVVAENL